MALVSRRSLCQNALRCAQRGTLLPRLVAKIIERRQGSFFSPRLARAWISRHSSGGGLIHRATLSFDPRPLDPKMRARVAPADLANNIRSRGSARRLRLASIDHCANHLQVPSMDV